jgi:protein-disulfide isomerase
MLDLSQVEFHSRGDNKSRHSFWIISNFTCSSCQENELAINQIYETFKDQFHFKYVHLSEEVNQSIILAECADKQGKYWEAHDLLFKGNNTGPEKLQKLIMATGINEKQCKECMQTFEERSLRENFAELNSLKITVTPTIMIDNRVYYGELSVKAVRKYLDELGDL